MLLTLVTAGVTFLSLAQTSIQAVTPIQLHWPYPNIIDYEEEVLYENGILGGVVFNCARRFPDTSNSTASAQWVRLAYHDMATHDIQTGTGGLDGSIRFELDRGENIGRGMTLSLRDFRTLQTAFTGMADLIAMGVVIAYQACDGPFIPYRGGRVDAIAAGPSGVPEPQQDLETFTEKFKNQGFNATEMIALVACGHVLGGVRKDDFGTVVEKDFEFFNQVQTYDNTIVTEYLDDTTENPLVASRNQTMRSDLRIFSSDNNVTMASLASRQVFDETCTNLLERMINTVPKDVTLTEVIEPMQYKVGPARLFVSNETDDLVFTTWLRILDAPENPDRTVTLFWNDRRGSFCPSSGCSAPVSDSQKLERVGNGFALLGMEAVRHTFQATVNSTTSISKFWFEIDEHDGSEKVVIDNGGSGYEVEQDDFLVDLAHSARRPGEDSSITLTTITVAVRDARPSPSKVYIQTFDPITPDELPFVPEVKIIDLLLDSTITPKAGYVFYSTPPFGEFTYFDATADFQDGHTLSQQFVRSEMIQILF